MEPAEVGFLQPDDDFYPVGLRDLEHPPSIYVQGRTASAPAVAVVGTRSCTGYGRDLAFEFGRILAQCGWSVVSGLARGIDACAHRGTLSVKGYAVGVLGHGLDIVYPKSNRTLYRDLLQGGGLLVTEYPIGTRPDRWRFPARNRLIAAIASALIVVEAAETGGALITARLAAEMGRPVFVVPGDVDRESSVGCNRLIRDGAQPVLGGLDLVEELKLAIGQIPNREVPELSFPPSGTSISELAARWECDFGEALVRLGRLTASGAVSVEGDRVYPR